MGAFINDVAPEQLAARLRGVLPAPQRATASWSTVKW
jgi:hypothetical protein